MLDTFFLVFVEGNYVDEEFLLKEKELSSHLYASGAFSRNSTGTVFVTFVGFAVWANKLILFIPKVYQASTTKNLLENSELAYLLLQVFKKYGREMYAKNPDARKLNHNLTDCRLSSFAIANWLTEDFFKNGIYRSTKKKASPSQNGVIDWSRTISRNTPHVSELSVTYLDYVSKGKVNDDSYFISRLHYSVLALCVLRYGNLLNLDLSLLDNDATSPLEEKEIFEFSQMYLLRELQYAYTDRSIQLLRNLQAFLEFNTLSSDKNFEIYGTQYFEKIWENICCDLVGNNINDWISNFPKPTWKSNSGDIAQAATLRPDIVLDYIIRGKKFVLLADAKYYYIKLPPILSGNPGIADVIKQLVYEQTIFEVASKNNTSFTGNFFIFPTSNQQRLFSIEGSVTYPGIASGLIKICYLDLTQAMQRYVDGKRLTEVEVAHFFDSPKALESSTVYP